MNVAVQSGSSATPILASPAGAKFINHRSGESLASRKRWGIPAAAATAVRTLQRHDWKSAGLAYEVRRRGVVILLPSKPALLSESAHGGRYGLSGFGSEKQAAPRGGRIATKTLELWQKMRVTAATACAVRGVEIGRPPSAW